MQLGVGGGQANIYTSIYNFIVLVLFLLSSTGMALFLLPFFFLLKSRKMLDFFSKRNMITSNVLPTLNIPFSHFVSLAWFPTSLAYSIYFHDKEKNLIQLAFLIYSLHSNLPMKMQMC